MDHVKARELRERRAKLVADAQAIFDKEARTADDNAKFDTMMASADALKLDIDRAERMETAAAETRATGRPPAGKIDGDGSDDAAKQVRFGQVWTRTMKYDGPAQFGFRGISADDSAFMLEHRDMGTGGGNALQGTGGGYFVPVGFVNKVEKAEKFYGNMQNISTIMATSTGQPLPYPTSNDTGTVGELIGEGTTVTLTSDITLGNVTFGAYKYSTKMVKLSIELLQDSAFDFDTFLAEAFGERLGRIRNTHYTVGTGSSQPHGILTAATAGPTAVGSSTNDGGAETGGTSIGSDDVIELEHSIDPAYRRGSIYVGHDSTIKSLKKLKDKYGRPLWLPGLAVSAPDTLNGYGYSVNNDMPTIAVNAKTLLFGQAKKYMIREVKELSILRLVERFAEFGQVAFIGFARSDGNLLDAGTHPVKYLVQAAS